MKRKQIPLSKKLLIVLAALIVLVFGGLLLSSLSPAAGAYGADLLRKIIGNRAVATLETVSFTLKDDLRNLEYHLGLARPATPWGSLADSGDAKLPAAPITSGALSTPSATGSTPTPAAPDWAPPAADALGSLTGVGVWTPYIQDDQGHMLAYRTFVQPDPDRPYAVTEVVAFNLDRLRLHYVLGYAEPYAPHVKKAGTGIIPGHDMQPGRLVAAFNGGFKYEHGKFGSMANGYESVPPVTGLGTLAFFKNGQIKMGVWGQDFTSAADMIAFRQNGPLIIQNGKIDQSIYDPTAWGYTISGGTVTWRSGLAISPDGKTLYYFAGSYLDISSLSKAILAVHPQTAMQLDINDFWVHFTAFQLVNGKLAAVALFPKEMKSELLRFLQPYQRDFFYITTP